VNTFLVFCIFLASFYRTGRERAVCLMLVAYSSVMSIASGYIDAEYYSLYYLLDALAAWLVINTISKIKQPTKMITDIQNACLWFIYANLFGWVSFMLYLSHINYNYICIAIYFLVLKDILNKGKKNDLGSSAMAGGRFGFFLDHNPCYSEVQRNQTAKNP